MGKKVPPKQKRPKKNAKYSFKPSQSPRHDDDSHDEDNDEDEDDDDDDSPFQEIANRFQPVEVEEKGGEVDPGCRGLFSGVDGDSCDEWGFGGDNEDHKEGRADCRGAVSTWDENNGKKSGVAPPEPNGHDDTTRQTEYSFPRELEYGNEDDDDDKSNDEEDDDSADERETTFLEEYVYNHAFSRKPDEKVKENGFLDEG